MLKYNNQGSCADTFACSQNSGGYCLACSYECRYLEASSPVQKDRPWVTAGGHEIQEKVYCVKGFSDRQINILGILREHTGVVLSYRYIAELVTKLYGLETTEGQARGALSRFRRRNFLAQKRGQEGLRKGNYYMFLRDPCEYIQPCSIKGMTVGVSPQANMQDAVSLRQNGVLYSLEEIDRKNLSKNACRVGSHMRIGDMESLSEADMELYWPCLVADGFGTNQLRQVSQRLRKAGIANLNVLQGLHYAEWDLEHGTMRTAKGEPVASSTNWVFTILARQGYYPRPQGYISPEEQVELDAQAERARLKELRDLRQKEEFALWEESLSQEEQERIIHDVTKGRGASDKTPLRIYFKEKVWREFLLRQKNDDGDASG